ncbi:MAG: hypothetical protein GTN69_08825 [Armatimonadetes bacterium]|nr:hypothetical protein [Armatimonadota bacterium]
MADEVTYDVFLSHNSQPKSPRAPSPLCEGAFFFGVKVRYLVGKVLTGIESLSQLW